MAYLGKKKKQNQTKKRMLSQRSTIYNMKREECLKKKGWSICHTVYWVYVTAFMITGLEANPDIAWVYKTVMWFFFFRPFRVGIANTSNTCA